MITQARYVAIGLLLFLVIAVDFTSKLLSVVADGVLVAGVVVLALPLINGKKK
ncbi:DUF3927 family protein [Pantoea sp. LMR881]|uniref:DUF3927 family protein n=1 Tax=Pantoea sp. LMR881 TaxID=3014336 RepID=UPI0022B05F9D|nr:DUF3927 family protein [Pantoea sp. LMR881]MCZ4058204.1 DUF3927 family protein [Pantoea sp. LMR881]